MNRPRLGISHFRRYTGKSEIKNARDKVVDSALEWRKKLKEKVLSVDPFSGPTEEQVAEDDLIRSIEELIRLQEQKG